MAHPSRNGNWRAREGFTLLELLVVLLIIGILAGLAVPSIQGTLTRAREAALLENLVVMRRAIDDYYADRAAYPASLAALVDERYLRFVPKDPVAVAGEARWEEIVEKDVDGVSDVRSTSAEIGSNGIAYREW